MARAFVAVRPPHAVLDAIAARVSDLPFGDGARLTGRAQWHITVQFLGDDCDVDQVATALPGLMIGAAEVQLGPPAPLGNSTRAKVCALAARGGDWWRDLAAVVAAQLRPLGFQPDSRPYVPHLTIARYRQATNMRALVRAAGTAPVGDPWVVREVVLFESRLGAGPAVHTARAVVPLAAG